MTDNEMDSGFELVLDNRRLIAAFAIFAVICGAFFVIGYTTGKRQGEIGATATGTAETLATPAAPESASSDAPPVQEDEGRKDLEWYQSVSGEEEEPAGITPPKPSTGTAAKTAAPVTAKTIYSVQVGAFSTRERAEAHAADIRSKGFDSRVQEPTGSGGLFLVRVGRFNTKPEAAQVQLQLKKKGFDAAIKTN